MSFNNIVEGEIWSGNVNVVKRSRVKCYVFFYQFGRWNDNVYVLLNNCYNYVSINRIDIFVQFGKVMRKLFLWIFIGDDVKKLVMLDGCVFVKVKKIMFVFFGNEYFVDF